MRKTSDPRASSASLLALALLAPSAASAQEASQLSQQVAQQRFDRATEAFNARRYEEALAEFRASYRSFASPNSLLFAARCLRELNRLDEAVLDFERARREAQDRARTDPAYVPTVNAAAAALSALASRVGRVRLELRAAGASAAPSGARITLDEREIPAEALGLSLPVMPGRHRVRVLAEGYAEGSLEREVAAGSEETLTVELERPAPAPGPVLLAPLPPPLVDRSAPRYAGIAVAAVGALGLAFTGIAWWQATQRFNALQAACPNFGCTTPPEDAVNAGRAWQTTTQVSAALGAVALAAGGAVLAWSLVPARAPVRAAWTGQGVALGGSF